MSSASDILNWGGRIVNAGEALLDEGGGGGGASGGPATDAQAQDAAAAQGQVSTVIPGVLEVVGPPSAPMGQKQGVLFGKFTTDKASDAAWGLGILVATHALAGWGGFEMGKKAAVKKLAHMNQKDRNAAYKWAKGA